MCLGVPGRVMRVQGATALVDFGGIVREVDVSLVDVEPGDYVVVHAGIAISELKPEEAEEILETWRELLESLEEHSP
ncbi:MAG: HypC/HybG/HupF family hydrogenase formation chaperone [Candidatus Korarchaeota archaeon]|nr:HypC/HybG/HupF family hydrogenase formation chaperone [Candidatus Korarchaeota archaeon]